MLIGKFVYRRGDEWKLPYYWKSYTVNESPKFCRAFFKTIDIQVNWYTPCWEVNDGFWMSALYTIICQLPLFASKSVVTWAYSREIMNFSILGNRYELQVVKNWAFSICHRSVTLRVILWQRRLATPALFALVHWYSSLACCRFPNFQRHSFWPNMLWDGVHMKRHRSFIFQALSTLTVPLHVDSPYAYQINLYGLLYSTNATTRRQTVDHNVEGSKAMISKRIQYASWGTR